MLSPSATSLPARGERVKMVDRRSATVCAFSVMLLALGCGQKPVDVGQSAAPVEEKIVPVRGNVYLDGQPLSQKGVMISFYPEADAAQPTAAGFAFVAEDGGFELQTNGKKGVKGIAPGRYRATVTMVMNKSLKMRAKEVSFPARYSSRAESPLIFEVAENVPPGAYDVKLTRN